MIAQQLPLIKWASETSVTRFFPSEYGTDIEYSPQSASEKPHQQKLKVRRYMATVKNLEWTYLVTGPYSDLFFAPNAARPEVGSFDVKEKKAWLLGDGRGRISFTAMAEYDASHGSPKAGLTSRQCWQTSCSSITKSRRVTQQSSDCQFFHQRARGDPC